jgi:uncharacterized protein YjiS (DUF1127 family)
MNQTFHGAAQAAIIPSPAGLLQTALVAAQRWLLTRRTAWALERLDDAQLKDIGLSRSTIPFTANSVRPGRFDVIWGPAALDGAAPVAVRLRGA